MTISPHFVSVRDYTTVVNGTTSNQTELQQAIDVAFTSNSALLWPAGTYVTTDNLTNFDKLKHIGNGLIKRGSTIFNVANPGESRNVIFVSPEGTGDGLSAAQPATLAKAFDFLKLQGPILSGRWRISLAAGTYTPLATQITGFSANQYIEIQGPAVSYGTPTAIIDAAGASWCLYFSGAFSVWLKDIKGVNATGNSVAAPFICDNSNVLFADNVHTSNSQWAGINANNCSRLIVYGGRYENSANFGIRGYGGTLVSIGRAEYRPQLVNCLSGVDLQGGAYGHVDFCDYLDCQVGIKATFNIHASNYTSTFTNCSVGWETDETSTVNAAGYTLSNVAITSRSRGSASYLDRGYENQFYPNNGLNGRSSFGYTTWTPATVKWQYSNNGTKAGFSLSSLAPATALWESSGNTILALAAPDTSYTSVWFANSQSPRHCEIRAASSVLSMVFNTVSGYTFSAARLTPSTDNDKPLGSASLRFSTAFFGTAPAVSSDEGLKQQIKPIDDACLKAWAKVEYVQYKFNDAVEAKGDGARWHFGLIAQRVKAAFESEGLNAFDYGLLCHDSWKSQEEILDEEGAVIQHAMNTGERFGIRYEEALALECAYLRSLIIK
ncbi:MAG: tail fiber domain-containing protein [Pseudomonas sp.]